MTKEQVDNLQEMSNKMEQYISAITANDVERKWELLGIIIEFIIFYYSVPGKHEEGDKVAIGINELKAMFGRITALMIYHGDVEKK